MSTTIHIYDAASGVFSGKSLHTDEANAASVARFIKANTPAGHAAFVGADVDRRSQRVDIVTGQLIDYQPPQPSSDHEWNATNKRWHLTQAVQAKQAARSTALAKIAALEASGVRCARELALGQAGSLDRLKALDIEIAAQRLDL